MQLINAALFLNATGLFLFYISESVTVIVPFKIIYTSVKSHKSDLSIGVFILISLLALYFFLIDHKL